MRGRAVYQEGEVKITNIGRREYIGTTRVGELRWAESREHNVRAFQCLRKSVIVLQLTLCTFRFRNNSEQYETTFNNYAVRVLSEVLGELLW